MKKVVAALLAILLVIGIVPVALAEDISPVKVSTLDELQEAIANAENGDTICVTQTIITSGNILIWRRREKYYTLRDKRHINPLTYPRNVWS